MKGIMNFAGERGKRTTERKDGEDSKKKKRREERRKKNQTKEKEKIKFIRNIGREKKKIGEKTKAAMNEWKQE